MFTAKELTTFASPNTAQDRSSANFTGAGSRSACAPQRDYTGRQKAQKEVFLLIGCCNAIFLKEYLGKMTEE